MNKRKLLERVRNNPRDVRFTDLVVLAEAFGYTSRGVRGSHHVYRPPRVPVPLNVQPGDHGKAKAYQVRQFIRDITIYGIEMEDER